MSENGIKRNVPSTEEIVRLLRMCATTCEGDCYYYDNRDVCAAVLKKGAADRLESLEREIECLQGETFANALESAERIATLTARAEQAERERDAFMKECDTGRTAGYKEGLEEGYKKGRDEGYDTAWKEARYEMNEY